jgi:hypothetical protein
VQRSEADDVRSFMREYTNRLRMEYGQAMAIAGFEPALIIQVQQDVARNMIEWLEA